MKDDCRMFSRKINDLKLADLENDQLSKGVRVAGWIRSTRVSSQVAFIVLNDGSCHRSLQLVVPKSNGALFEQMSQLTTGAAIEASGTLVESHAKGQEIELQVEELVLVGSADSKTYPLQKKGHSLEFLREIAHLRSRTNTFNAVFRLRHGLSFAIHQFFNDRGFYWAHTPLFTGSDAEGAGELFRASVGDGKKEFFGCPTFLTVSGQLQAESMAMGLGQVYTFGPTFRAENSNTARHLAEFWMIEPEVAFADLAANMELAEDFLKYLFNYACDHFGPELEFFHKFYKSFSTAELRGLAKEPFEKISYRKAVELLAKSGQKFEFLPEFGKELQTEHERYLCEKVFKKPVIVHDYPKESKAFYMRVNDDNETVAAMDVLVPGVGEIIGGSQREERLDVLEERMKSMGVDTEELQWYLDLRRFGTVPHAGFGLGLERLVMYISGMANIRDVIPSPRCPNSIGF